MIKRRRSKVMRRVGIAFCSVFIFLNVVAAMHAWRFTHFTNSNQARNEHPQHLSMAAKALILLTGIPNPRPVNKRLPAIPYQNVILQSNV